MGEMMTREVLLAQGWTTRQIRQAIRRSELRRLWPSVYTDVPRGAPWVEYTRTVRAAGLIGGWGVTSHQSAGALWGLPMLHVDTARVHTTIPARTGGGLVSSRRHVHPRPLRDEDTVLLDGIELTSRARTTIDLAMAGTYEQALVVIDGARRTRRFPRPDDPAPVSLAELHSALDHLGRRPGRRIALRALADSTNASESAGESWSRARMLQWGLPMPRLQERFELGGRTYFADFRWGNLVGEFDGDGKYDTDADRRRYEKRRDGDFAAVGITVCHWSWDDLTDRERFFTILTRSMCAAGVLAAIPPFPG